MTEDPIASVEIDDVGQLCVRPARGEFDLIYRAGMQVGWDPVRLQEVGTYTICGLNDPASSSCPQFFETHQQKALQS
jgi:hypothetical protein